MGQLLALAGFGFLLGMRHATDADHVIAVTTILNRSRRFAHTTLIGALWGLGHTITVVIVGVAIMVMGAPFIGRVDDMLGLGLVDSTAAATTARIDMEYAWFGNLLALTIAIVFAMVTVVTRRFPNVRQTPGASVGCFAASLFAFSQAGSVQVTGGEIAILLALGMANLGLGMAFFVTGARMIPAAFAALLGTAVFFIVLVFLAKLTVGYVYEWRKGGLKWR